MKKRLLSLVLCLVMVFSLLPFGTFAVSRKEPGYVKITDNTTWTPSSDYAAYAGRSNETTNTSDPSKRGKLYYLHEGQYYEVQYDRGDVYEDAGAGWTAAGVSSYGQTLYYKNDSAYERVIVSALPYYKNAGNSISASDFNSDHNWSYQINQTMKNTYYYNSAADSEYPFWHQVYLNYRGVFLDGFYFYLWYYTEGETSMKDGSTISKDDHTSNSTNWGDQFRNAYSGGKVAFIPYVYSNGPNDGWQPGGNAGDKFYHAWDSYMSGSNKYTGGELYKRIANNSVYNNMETETTHLHLAWPKTQTADGNGCPGSTTFGGHLYTLNNNGIKNLYITVNGQNIYADEAKETTDTILTGDLYYWSDYAEASQIEDVNTTTTTESGEDGVVVSKKLTQNAADGSKYDVTLTGYTTGNFVKTEEHTETPVVVPMDIVLVVDQSASMATKDMGDDYAPAEMPAGGWTVAAATGGVTHYVKVGTNYYPVQAESDYVYEMQENVDIAASDEIGWGDDAISLGVNGAPTFYNVDTDYYVYYNGEMHKLFLITAGLFGNYGLYPYIYTNNSDPFVKADKWEGHNYWVAIFDPWDGSDLRDNGKWNTLATANPSRISFVNADGQAIGSSDDDADNVKQTYSWFRDSATSGLTGTGIPMNGLYQLSRSKVAAKLYYTDNSGVKHYFGNSATFADSVVYQNDDENVGPLYVGNSTSRVQALQSAVTDFANEVRANAEENGVDHRMAVVGFAQNRVPNFSTTENPVGPTTVGSNGKLDYSNTGIFTSNGSGGYTFKNYEVITGYAQTSDHYINRHYFYNGEPYTFAGEYWKPIDGSGSTIRNYDSQVGGSNWKKSVYQTETGTSLTPADYQNAMVSVNVNDALNGQISYAIDNFATYGGSYTSYGMTMAEKLFQYADDSQAVDSEGNPTQRERVIIVFTDGEPGETSFESAIAGEALVSANNMKTADHNATVYTVGLYKNAVNSQTSDFMSKLSSEYTNTLSEVYGGADNSARNGLGQLDPSKTYYYVGDGGKYFALTTEYGDSDSLGWWVHNGSHTGTTESYSQVTPKTSTGAGSTVFYNASGSEVQGDNVKTGTTYYTANHDKIVYEYRWYDSNHSVKNPVISGTDDGLDTRVQFYDLTAETANTDGAAYYMTAANASELNGVFNKIIKMQIKDTVTVTSGTQYTDDTLYVMDEISAGFDKTAATVVNVYADPATFDPDGNLTGFTESTSALRQGTRQDIEQGNADVSVTWQGKKVFVDYFDWGRKYVQSENPNAARIRVVITNLAPNTVGNASVTSDLDPYSDSESGNALWALPSNTAQSGLYLTERDNSGNKLSSTLVESFKVPSAPVPGYTVTWVDEDGTELDSMQDLLPGTAVAYGGPTPAKASDDDYHYTFKGFTDNNVLYAAVLDDVGNIESFDPAFPNMGNANVTYTAVYESTLIEKYDVTWMMPEGFEMNGAQLLELDENVVSGTMPEYNGELPAINANDEYSYFFAGWHKGESVGPFTEIADVQANVDSLEPVDGDVTYYAVFGKKVIPVKDYVVDYGVKHVLDTGVSGFDVINQPGGEFGLDEGSFSFTPKMNALGKYQSYTSTGSREFKVMDLTGMSQVNTAVYNKDAAYTRVNVVAASNIYLDDSITDVSVTPYDSSAANYKLLNDQEYKDALEAVGMADGDTAKVDYAQPIALTFTGDAIEVYAKTNANSKTVIAYLLDKDGNRLNSAATNTSSSTGTLYNVPVLRYEVEYGTYTLVLIPSATADFQLDGVRVFNANPQQQAKYLNVRQELLKANPLVDGDGNPIDAIFDGAVYLIGKDPTTSVAEYKKSGPKNEVYLSGGEKIAFIVPTGSTNLRIGLSAVDGNPVAVKLTNAENAQAQTIENAIHMFYDITPYTGTVTVDGQEQQVQMVVIENANADGTDGILSVTDLQYTAPTFGMFKVSRSLMNYVQTFDERPIVAPETVQPPVETPDPTSDPTPDIGGWISQMISNFVNSLFNSIARLFGGH